MYAFLCAHPYARIRPAPVGTRFALANKRTVTLDPARVMRVVVAATLVLFILAVYPNTPQPGLDAKVMLAPLSALVLSVLLLWQAMREREAPRPGLLFPLLAAFVAVNAFAGLISRHPGNSLAETGRLVSFIVIFLAASRAYSDRQQMKRLFLTVCIGMAIASAFGFMQRLGFDPVTLSDPAETRNLASTFGNSNYAGHTLVLALVLAAYLAEAEKSRVALALLPVFAIHLALTHHRAGQLAAVSAVMFALLLLALARRTSIRSVRSDRSVRSFLAIPLAAAILIIVAILALSGPRLPLDGSLLLRYNSYFSACKMIAAEPVLGYGPGNYVIENAPFWTPMEQEHFARQQLINDHPHCEILYAAVSGGLPASAIFLAMIAAMLVGSTLLFWRAPNPAGRNLALMFAAFFFAWSVDGLFGFNFKAPASGALFAVVAGLFDRATSMGQAKSPNTRRVLLAAGLVAAALCFSFLSVRAFAAAVLVNSARHDISYGARSPAQKMLERAEDLDPWNWGISYLEWHAAYAANQGADAQACLQRTLQKNPHFLPALVDLAQLLVNSGDNDRAEQYARAALDLSKSFPQALDVLGTAALMRAAKTSDARKRGELLEQSRAYYVDAIAGGGENKCLLHTRIGQTHVLEGDFQAAEEKFQAAAKFCPPDAELWKSYEQVAIGTNSFAGYIDSLQTAISAMKRDRKKYQHILGSTNWWLGGAYGRAGDRERACAAFKEAVQCDPELLNAWGRYQAYATELNRLGDFFADVGKLKPGLMNEPNAPLHTAYARHLLATAGPAAARAHIIDVLGRLKFSEAARRALQSEPAGLSETQQR